MFPWRWFREQLFESQAWLWTGHDHSYTWDLPSWVFFS